LPFAIATGGVGLAVGVVVPKDVRISLPFTIATGAVGSAVGVVVPKDVKT